MKRYLATALTLALVLGLAGLADAQTNKAAGKASPNDSCQSLAKRQRVPSGQMDEFMRACVDKLQREAKGDVNYPAGAKVQEKSGR